jgi:hypothetical protein
MSTIINTPGSLTSDNGGIGMIVGILLVVIVGVLFYLYALPTLRNEEVKPTTTEIKVELPNPPASAPTPSPTPAPAQ